MPLWKKLYNTVWLAFFSCLPLSDWLGTRVGTGLHVLLGVLLLVAVAGNVRRLGALAVPPRLQRISRATLGFSVFQLAAGLALGGVQHLLPDLPLLAGILRGLHVVAALTILAQASSVATGHDMWEEREIGPAPPTP